MVSEEVDGGEARGDDCSERVRLIPSGRELKVGGGGKGREGKKSAKVPQTPKWAVDTHDVERDLATDRVGETIVGELLLEDLDKLLSDVVDLVVRLEVESLLDGRVPTDGRDVDHAVSELDEGSSEVYKEIPEDEVRKSGDIWGRRRAYRLIGMSRSAM